MSCRNPHAHDVPQCDAAHRDVNVRNATGTNRARISCASRYGVCSRLDVAAYRCDLRYPDVARESCVWPGRQRVKTACRSAHGTMSHRATLRIATLTSGTRPERTASESAATHDARFVHGQMSYVAASAHYIQRTYALPRWLRPAIRKRKGPACAGPFVGEACRATHRSGLQNATSERHLGAEAGRAKLRVGVERARRARLPCDHEADGAADIPIEAGGVDILSASGDARSMTRMSFELVASSSVHGMSMMPPSIANPAAERQRAGYGTATDEFVLAPGLGTYLCKFRPEAPQPIRPEAQRRR